ncbi:MAG: hypothetical protein RLZZ165_314 [Bacteroidota bacterium]|jgi:WD40 repeat protein
MVVTKIREYTGHTAAIYSLCKAARAGHFISCGSEGIVAEWNLETGEGKGIVQAPAAVFSICMLADRDLLLLGLQTGELVFVDVRNAQTIKRVRLHQGAIFDLLPLHDRLHLLASGEDGAISVWNLDRMDHLHYQPVSKKSLRTMVHDPETGALYVGASDELIREFDPGLRPRREWKAHSPSVFRLLMGQGGRLVSTGRDAHLRLWDVHEGDRPALLAAVPAHLFAVNDLVFGPDGRLYSGSMDKSIKVWKPDGLELLKVINFEKNQCHWNGVNRLLWIEDTLLSCSDDRKIMAWKVREG